MDLFVINRHEETNKTVDEQQNLDRILKRIEKNKELRAARRKKNKEQIPKEQANKTIYAGNVLQSEQHKESNNNNEKSLDNTIKNNDAEDPVPKKKSKMEQSDIGFTILGTDSFSKKAKVKRVLPKWLANPTIISANLQELKKKVSTLTDLDKKLRRKLKQGGIKYFFPVQAEVIPYLLESYKHSDIVFPRDICVSAPTGSGKTLAFVLPIVQALMRYRIKKIRALIILPTQELAIQVFKTFQKFTEDTCIDVCLITGKNSFEHEQKQLIYKNEAFGYLSKADILVCTAGRLVDHLKSTEGFDLRSLEFLVIDEADRVLDSVQHDWLYHLEKHISNDDPNLQFSRVLNLFTLKRQRPPQKLLFSATLSQDPEKLQKLSLFQPKLFTSVVESKSTDGGDVLTANTFIGKYTTPNELTEKYIVSSLDLKPLVLYEYIKLEKLTKTMVFTHSIESTHRLAILLEALFKKEMRVKEISSNLDMRSRRTLIDDFSSGNIDILVCTDALARGIDLPGVQCVISYSAPKYLKTYIHRAGRTARAGETGLAITMLHQSQLAKFRSLLEQADKTNIEEIKIAEDTLEPLGDQYKQALVDLKSTVVKEEKKLLTKIKTAKRNVKKTKKQIVNK